MEKNSDCSQCLPVTRLNVLKTPSISSAMINKLGTDINSSHESDIKNPIKILAEAKPT